MRMPRRKKVKLPEILYQVVKIIDDGGCFGAETYEVLKETTDKEDALWTLDFQRSLDRYSWSDYTVRVKAHG
jgi:hypothetical protein